MSASIKLLPIYIVGITLSFYYGDQVNPHYLFSINGILAISCIITYKYRYTCSILIYILCFNTGLSSQFDYHNSKKLAKRIYETSKTYKKQLIQIKNIKRKSDYMLLDIDWHVTKSDILKLKAYLKEDDPLLVEHTNIYTDITLKQLSAPRNEFDFDYKSYLNKQAIFLQASVNNFQPCKLDQNGWYQQLQLFINQIRDAQIHSLKQNIKNLNNYSIAQAMLLGFKQNIDNETSSYYSKSGAMHLLAVSGLHVGILSMILVSILNFILPNLKFRLIKIFILLSSLWFYLLMTGASPSVKRTVIMASLYFIAKALCVQTKSIHIVSVTAFALLIINPLNLFKLGFQFSFIAVAGILILYKPLENIYKPKKRITTYIWSLSCVTLAAQIALFPLSLYYFKNFPTYFLLSSFIAIPIAYLIVSTGIFTLIINSVLRSDHSKITSLCFDILEIEIGILNHTLELISKLPYAQITAYPLSILTVVLFYVVICLATTFILHQKKCIIYFILFATLVLNVKIYNTRLNHFKSTYVAVPSFYKASGLYLKVDNKVHELSFPNTKKKETIKEFSNTNGFIRYDYSIVFSEDQCYSLKVDNLSCLIYPTFDIINNYDLKLFDLIVLNKNFKFKNYSGSSNYNNLIISDSSLTPKDLDFIKTYFKESEIRHSIQSQEKYDLHD